MSTWFAVIALAITALTLVVAVSAALGIILVRLHRVRRHRRWGIRDRHVRPLLLQVLDGGPVIVDKRADRLHLIEIAVRAAHNVRGADRATIATWLRGAGALTEATRLLRSHSALARARGIELYLPIADGHSRVLERMITDRNRAVRSLACEALGRAAAVESIPALLAATGAGRRQLPPAMTMMAITRMTPPRADVLLVPAATLAVSVQMLAVELVGVLNLIDGRRAVEQTLTHPVPALRTAALRTLAQLALPLSAPAIAQHRATDPDEDAALKLAHAVVSRTVEQ